MHKRMKLIQKLDGGHMEPIKQRLPPKICHHWGGRLWSFPAIHLYPLSLEPALRLPFGNPTHQSPCGPGGDWPTPSSRGMPKSQGYHSCLSYWVRCLIQSKWMSGIQAFAGIIFWMLKLLSWRILMLQVLVAILTQVGKTWLRIKSTKRTAEMKEKAA